MMKSVFIFLGILLLIITNSFAQGGKLDRDTSAVFLRRPLFVVKQEGRADLYSVLSALSLINQEEIQAMEILKDSEAEERFQENGKNGVVIITVKKSTSLLTISEIFKKYNIKKRFRNLPVFVDSTIVYSHGIILSSPNKIVSVNVAKEKETKLKYISIITNNVKSTRKPGEIYTCSLIDRKAKKILVN